MTDWIIGMVWGALKAFICGLGGPQLALLAGGSMFALLLVSTVLGTMKKHMGKLAIGSGVLMLAAWHWWPVPPPAPKVELAKFTMPKFKLPEVTLPEIDLPDIHLPELPEITLPELPTFKEDPEAARLAEEARLAAERAHRLAEKKARERARKAVIRARNRLAEQQINAYLAQGISQAQAQWEAEQRARAEWARGMMTPRPLMSLPPGSRLVRGRD